MRQTHTGPGWARIGASADVAPISCLHEEDVSQAGEGALRHSVLRLEVCSHSAPLARSACARIQAWYLLTRVMMVAAAAFVTQDVVRKGILYGLVHREVV
jgi:hypothetical protein